MPAATKSTGDMFISSPVSAIAPSCTQPLIHAGKKSLVFHGPPRLSPVMRAGR